MGRFKIDKQRKYIFFALGALVFLGLIYRFLPVLQAMVSPAREIESKEMKVLKYRKMVEHGKGLKEEFQSLNKTLNELESRLLTQGTPSLAAAEIQKILHVIVNKSGVEIRRVKVLKPEELAQEDCLSVPIEFYICPNVRQLKEILYRIATYPKYLTVQKLKTTFHKTKNREFRCFITVAGFMKRA